ncbi:MAG TPA: hypothetical protein VFA60_08655 [Terriglobales bacterium]|nr:hypothetical protein [Terriglobales bacterium]
MKRMLIILIVVGALATAWSQTGKPSGRLDELARRARAEGRSEVQIGIGDIETLDASSLTEALSNFTVVLAQPITSISVRRGDSIVTWTKFNAIEFLALRPNCEACSFRQEPPETLLPFGSNQFVLPIPGGTVDVEGIKVRSSGKHTVLFEPGKTYLLLLNMNSIGQARLDAGVSGAFFVNDDGTIRPISKHNVRWAKELQEHYPSVAAVRGATKPASK